VKETLLFGDHVDFPVQVSCITKPLSEFQSFALGEQPGASHTSDELAPKPSRPPENSEFVNKSSVHPDRCVACSLAPRLSTRYVSSLAPRLLALGAARYDFFTTTQASATLAQLPDEPVESQCRPSPGYRLGPGRHQVKFANRLSASFCPSSKYFFCAVLSFNEMVMLSRFFGLRI
jgi:hypothetical protein